MYNYQDLTEEQLRVLAQYLGIVPVGDLQVTNLSMGSLLQVKYKTNVHSIQKQFQGKPCTGTVYEEYCVQAKNTVVTNSSASYVFTADEPRFRCFNHVKAIPNSTYTKKADRTNALRAFLTDNLPNADREIKQDNILCLLQTIKSDEQALDFAQRQREVQIANIDENIRMRTERVASGRAMLQQLQEEFEQCYPQSEE